MIFQIVSSLHQNQYGFDLVNLVYIVNIKKDIVSPRKKDGN